ncbi:MAG: PDZ domain-containing protein [Myxococcota bacterium]
MHVTIILFLAAIALQPARLVYASEDGTRFLQMPDASDRHLVFVYAGDLWVSDRDGSNPRRLTTGPDQDSHPRFSPDGRVVAYSSNVNRNQDVFLIATEGGSPKRLTWHPADDWVRGFTPKGDVVFASGRKAPLWRRTQLFVVSPEGGLPTALPLPQAFDGAYAPDAKRLAYQPFQPAQFGPSGWDRHRGGTTPPIWIYEFETDEVEEIPRERVNDTNPMWVGEKVYFLSDRADVVNLFSYDIQTKKVEQLTKRVDWDIDSAGAGPDVIVYEAGGQLHNFDVKTGESRALRIDLKADWPQLSPSWKDASKSMVAQDISPSGIRVAFAARGDIFTVPVEGGSIRNLTKSDDVNDRDPLWSPDGARLAYLSDGDGRFRVVIVDQAGLAIQDSIPLEEGPYFRLLSWSPSGRHIAYADNHLNLFVLNVETKRSRKVGTHSYRISGPDFSPAFSPDGRWMAFVENRENYFSVLKIYDVEKEKTRQVTEGMAEVTSPVFSRDGAFLYIAGSTNFGPRTVGLDMTVNDRPVRRALYGIVLDQEGDSPLPLRTADEDSAVEDSKDDGKEPEKATTRIDFDGLEARMVPLPVPQRDYTSLSVAHDGSLLYLDNRQEGVVQEPPELRDPAIHTLRRYDFERRKEKAVVAGRVASYALSRDGTKILVRGPKKSWMVRSVDPKDEKSSKKLDLAGMRVRVDPKHEWRHIFRDVWRMEAQYFYAENMHGIDWEDIRKKYEPLLDHVASRQDLNTLLIEMIAELEVGHNRIAGGDVVQPKNIPVGLLGADFVVERGRYRVSKVYEGGSWNPFLRAPLAVPGQRVREGDYILAIDGEDLVGSENIHQRLEGTAGQQVILTVHGKPSSDDARMVRVVPVKDEFDLRRWSWIESNRRRVEQATDGRAGYIYLPDTGGDGFEYFNRMFFAQVDKEALVIDERSNRGGQAANYILEVLARPYLSSWKDRDGRLFTTPAGVVKGPKVMLVDQNAGSGGDYLPWGFRRLGLGKLVGTRTWGGLIGIYANPRLIDGGVVTVPYFRFTTPEGRWAVENEGVPPDIEVQLTPKAAKAGRDPQLERAIEVINDELKSYESPIIRKAPPLPTSLGE